MPSKDINKRREAGRKHYRGHKEAYLIRRKKRRQLITAVIREFKNVAPCADCKQSYPHYVMDFDHVRGDKKFILSSAATKGASLKRVLEEVKKCDIVCANCHRIRTFKEKLSGSTNSGGTSRKFRKRPKHSSKRVDFQLR